MPIPLSRTRIVQRSGRSFGAVSISTTHFDLLGSEYLIALFAECLAHPLAGRYEAIALFTSGPRIVSR